MIVLKNASCINIFVYKCAHHNTPVCCTSKVFLIQFLLTPLTSVLMESLVTVTFTFILKYPSTIRKKNCESIHHKTTLSNTHRQTHGCNSYIYIHNYYSQLNFVHSKCRSFLTFNHYIAVDKIIILLSCLHFFSIY